jgi:hypothetical protein
MMATTSRGFCLRCGGRGRGGYPRHGFLSLFYPLGYVSHQLFQIVLDGLEPSGTVHYRGAIMVSREAWMGNRYFGECTDRLEPGVRSRRVFGFKIRRYDPQCDMVEAFPIKLASEI